MYQPIPLNDPNRMRWALTRIYNSDRTAVVGGGFLVTNWQVLTCAHVVEKATGQTTPILSNDVYVWIDFPYIPNSPKIKTRVEAFWDSKTPYDIARLNLESQIQGPFPVPLCLSSTNMLQQKISCIGFPGALSDGLTEEGIIVGLNAKAWYQVNDTGITSGYSGCPIWHNGLGGVVGMVVSRVDELKKGVAFFIPSSMLLQMWGELPLSWNGDIPGGHPFGRLRNQDGFFYNAWINDTGQTSWF